MMQKEEKSDKKVSLLVGLYKEVFVEWGITHKGSDFLESHADQIEKVLLLSIDPEKYILDIVEQVS